MSKTNERAFEESIEESLTSRGGYVKGLAEAFNPEENPRHKAGVILRFIPEGTCYFYGPTGFFKEAAKEPAIDTSTLFSFLKSTQKFKLAKGAYYAI